MNLLGNRSPYSPEMTQLLGLDPAEMRRQAIFRGLQQAGVQLMSSGKLGDAFQGLSEGVNEAKDDYMQQQMLGYKMKTAEEDRAYQNEERAAKQAEREQWNAYVSTLPEDLQPAIRANPGLMDDYITANDPRFQPPPVPMQPTANMREFEYAQENPEFGTFIGGNKGGISADIEQRRTAASELGLAPDSPAYQSYVLTGKMPREDQAPLTATDKAAILAADEAVMTNQNVIDQLASVITVDPQTGLSLNDRAGSGFFAGAQSFAARNDPTGFFDDSKGEATTELQNVVLGQALSSLKSIFGAAPTEGERKILIDLQASVDKTPAERKPIVERAMALAAKRLAFNKQRAEALRGKTYYNPGGAPGAAPGGTTSSGVSWSIK
jgi:hypothetical protein